jgi:hypothetical protein
VAVLDSMELQPIPRQFVTKPDGKRATSLLRALLERVGTGQPVEELLDLVWYLRRPLAAAEIATLDPAWMQIPAIDLGNDTAAAPHPSESPIRVLRRG